MTDPKCALRPWHLRIQPRETPPRQEAVFSWAKASLPYSLSTPRYRLDAQRVDGTEDTTKDDGSIPSFLRVPTSEAASLRDARNGCLAVVGPSPGSRVDL